MASNCEPRKCLFKWGSRPLCRGLALAADSLCNACRALFLHKSTMRGHTTPESPSWKCGPKNNAASCSLSWIHLGCCLAVFLFSAHTTTGVKENTMNQGSSVFQSLLRMWAMFQSLCLHFLFLHSTFINHRSRPTQRVTMVVMPWASARSTAYNSHSCDETSLCHKIDLKPYLTFHKGNYHGLRSNLWYQTDGSGAHPHP